MMETRKSGFSRGCFFVFVVKRFKISVNSFIILLSSTVSAHKMSSKQGMNSCLLLGGYLYVFCRGGALCLFVRSQDGVSHSPAEWSTKDDCAAGAAVLYHTVWQLAQGE
ncbi:hypothetical protein B1690_14475 [Geobacillus sp. 46C-IIa]|nr:hypothetical protein B1690_14475 [Geobacillus sp. 46C-IIa]